MHFNFAVDQKNHFSRHFNFAVFRPRPRNREISMSRNFYATKYQESICTGAFTITEIAAIKKKGRKKPTQLYQQLLEPGNLEIDSIIKLSRVGITKDK